MLTQWIILIVVVGIVAVLVYLFYLMLRVFLAAWQRDRELAKNGVDVEAEVIDRQQKTAMDGTALCFITYRYRVPKPFDTHQELSATEQVYITEFDDYQIGTKLWVRYLPNKPSVVLRSQKVIGVS